MPFTSPLLTAVAGPSFDCLIETTGTYSNSSGSSAQFTNYMANGLFNVISDTKSIVQQVFNTSVRDAVQLTTSGTLKITVLENYTYTSASSSNKFGLEMVNLASDGDYSVTVTSYDHMLFNNSSQQTVTDETINNSMTRPGLVGSLFKSPAGGTFQTTGRLLIGINKT